MKGRIYNRFASPLVRVFSMILVISSILFLGTIFNPFDEEPRATVFDRLAHGFAPFIPYYPRAGWNSDPREIDINGNQAFYTVSITKDPMEDVLMKYRDLYRRDFMKFDEKTFFKKGFSLKTEEGRVYHALGRTFEDYYNSLFNNLFMSRGENWGALSLLDFPVDEPEELAERFEAFSKTTNLSDLDATGKTILTFKNGGETILFNLWTGRDFYLDRLYSDEGDAPGYDIPGIPRPPSSKRLFTITERMRKGLTQTAFYSGSGGILNHILHISDRMREEGWVKSGPFDYARHRTDVRNILFFLKKGRQALIGFTKGRGDEVITTVFVRSM